MVFWIAMVAIILMALCAILYLVVISTRH